MKPTPLKQRATVAKNTISRLLILSFVKCKFSLLNLQICSSSRHPEWGALPSPGEVPLSLSPASCSAPEIAMGPRSSPNVEDAKCTYFFKTVFIVF